MSTSSKGSGLSFGRCSSFESSGDESAVETTDFVGGTTRGEVDGGGGENVACNDEPSVCLGDQERCFGYARRTGKKISRGENVLVLILRRYSRSLRFLLGSV